CGYSAGGTTDLVTRVLAEGLQRKLGVPVVVENITGAGGTIAIAEMAKKPPDGYTIATTGASAQTALPLTTQLPYDNDSLSFVAKYLDFASVVAVRANSPYQTWEDLVAYGKANPGKVVYALDEVVGIPAIQVQLLAEKAGGFEYTLMACTGSAESIRALLAGDADFVNQSLPPLLAHIKEGTVRPLICPYPFGLAELPDLITSKAKYGIEIYAMAGLLAPKGTPEEIRKTLADAVKYVLENDQDTKNKLKAMNAYTSFMDGPAYKAMILDIRARVKAMMDAAK
ncbi:MAG: tripartite tricarboxylate transporter substrate binding protein, partial [Bacillota bacterium]|nr:tripartite tricarboxylate transporter substrate binding protein [Bacillota bacterium]